MKAQAFSLDFIFGLLITTATLTAVVLFLPENQPPFSGETERLAILMTEGIPVDWNETTVIIPGFLTDHRFNETKINAFASLSEHNQKKLLGIQSDFTITFTMNNTILPLCTSCGNATGTYHDILPLRRYSLLGSNITMMVVTLYR